MNNNHWKNPSVTQAYYVTQHNSFLTAEQNTSLKRYQKLKKIKKLKPGVPSYKPVHSTSNQTHKYKVPQSSIFYPVVFACRAGQSSLSGTAPQERRTGSGYRWPLELRLRCKDLRCNNLLRSRHRLLHLWLAHTFSGLLSLRFRIEPEYHKHDRKTSQTQRHFWIQSLPWHTW